ncbi:GNAT family N-acetyltransferase [Streptomyces sp. NA02950]|uniref:GNAT family N-acetyltransferase n=1 Tax=Streptomyces sp. NA02950 TaxID=2742137 RepID=UPI0020CB51CD|nr:GNAT family N-acetyltransferase [Streptomyces sp. NA02950]
MLKPVELQGAGLRLRPWENTPGDRRAALRGLTDPDFRRWNTPVALVDDEEDVRAWTHGRADGWRRGDMASFAVLEDTEIRGHVSLGVFDYGARSARVGYWVLPEARDRGIASRALRTITGWAFHDLGLHRLELRHDIGNEASCRVGLRCGYVPEGLLRQARFDLGGVPHDVHLHARLAVDDPRPDVPR